MPQLRRDLIAGRWVIISAERSKRPEDFPKVQEQPFDEGCPFCAGREDMTPPEIYAMRKPNSPEWEVRVVPNVAPILRIEGELNRAGRGVYDLMEGIGAHEVVVETPRHLAHLSDLEPEQIKKVINAYLYRINDLERDVRFKQVVIFKNFGVAAGSRRYKHTRSHLHATMISPKMIKDE